MAEDDLEFPALMTPEEVARVLRKTPAGVRYMLNKGTLKGVKIGQRWMIRSQDVRRVIEEGTQPVELAGGRKHPGHVVEDQDQEDDGRPAVSPDQLRLDVAKRGQSENVRRFPAARVVGDKGWS